LPARLSRSQLADIELAAVRSWPALETADLGGWLWRCSSGGSQRANSMATLAFDGRDVDAAVREAEGRYRAKGAACRFTITEVSKPADLDARLAVIGYERGQEHMTMAKEIAALPAAFPPPCGEGQDGWIAEHPISGFPPPPTPPRVMSKTCLRHDGEENPGAAAVSESFHPLRGAAKVVASSPADVTLSADPTPEWLAVYLAGLTPDRREVAPAILAGLPARRAYFSCLRAGTAVGTGLSIADASLASVQCMATLERARRQGCARAVLSAIEAWAAAQGSTHLYLQAETANAAAIALYEAFGFRVAGRYHLRTKR
jgi:ribosomal protein S18 acetylase RimI-like enzyme